MYAPVAFRTSKGGKRGKGGKGGKGQEKGRRGGGEKIQWDKEHGQPDSTLIAQQALFFYITGSGAISDAELVGLRMLTTTLVLVC